MPNLKDIKVRIKSVKSTQKITQAMKLVAASKVRKVQDKVMKARPYTEELNKITGNTAKALSESDRDEIPLMASKEINTVGIIVISSDRGLCGGYNANIIKSTIKRIKELEAEGKEVKLITIGNKATGFFRRTNTEILDTFTQLPNELTVELINEVRESACNAFLDGTVDKVEIIGTDFVSMIRSDVYNKDYLPVVPASHPEATEDKTEVLFEPSLNAVINALLPQFLSNSIFHALLEAQCSELANRMNAMSNATNNARDLIEKLTIVYNKARQAAITQEISEIVAGAEALA